MTIRVRLRPFAPDRDIPPIADPMNMANSEPVTAALVQQWHHQRTPDQVYHALVAVNGMVHVLTYAGAQDRCRRARAADGSLVSADD